MPIPRSISNQLRTTKSKIKNIALSINCDVNTDFETRVQLIGILNESESAIKTIEELLQILTREDCYKCESNVDYVHGFITAAIKRLGDLYDQLNDLKNKH